MSADAAERDLVARARSGDETAFAQLYRTHVGRVYAVCLRMVADRAAAEALTQDVFVRAWRGLAGFRGDSALGTWLHRLAVNEVLMAQRAERRREARVLTVDDPAEREAAPRAPEAGLGLDLERAIARLPRGAREVLVLHDVEGYGHAEVGKLLGIAVGTSKAQLFRARRLLRGWLER
jgi:RNA polymerase sigma-70 factor (ECF subfamily)